MFIHIYYSKFHQALVTTDASGYTIGGILSQGTMGKDLSIVYISQLLNKTEQNYSIIEKELLAIVYSVQFFRPYIYSKKFKLVTDHRISKMAVFIKRLDITPRSMAT